MNTKRLEEYPMFSFIGWMIVIGFALFTLRLTQTLIRVSEELSNVGGL